MLFSNSSKRCRTGVLQMAPTMRRRSLNNCGKSTNQRPPSNGNFLIAALNSIEPFVMNVAMIDLFYANEEWAKLRRPGAVEFVQDRLAALSQSLGGNPYLDGDRFTAGGLMMTTVLRILNHTDIVTSDARLAAYVERCTSRPAFRHALEAQLGDFRLTA